MEGLSYQFTCNAAPVQAEGTFRGSAFYFRSRHNEWTFLLSEDQVINPAAIQFTEQEDEYGFFASGFYKNASFMPLKEADEIIRQCLEEYVKRKLSS
jgi:hypothetical protein